MRDQLRALYVRTDGVLASFLPRTVMQAMHRVISRVGLVFFPNSEMLRNPGMLDALSKQSSAGNAPDLPGWLIDDLMELSTLDPHLHPKGALVSSARFYPAPWSFSASGDAYFDLARRFPNEVDAVVVVPWLKTGGADLGAIHFANALSAHFGRKVVVVATENADSPWASRLSDNVVFVDLGARLAALHPSHRIDVLVRLLLQFQPKILHVMNSQLGWEAIKRNGLAIRQRSRVFASLYCDDISASGQRVGYARDYLAACHRLLDGVISDNPITPQDWVDSIGIDPGLFHVVPFPAPDPAGHSAHGAGKRILWAGRLDRQKRPDLLAAVARAMPGYEFHVHGAAVIREGRNKQFTFPGNVKLMGPYKSFPDIARSQDYLAFLYTSQWDGLPNVLLEAASAGLPIVASDVGGIGSLLPAEQRVTPPDAVESYVMALERLAANPQVAAQWQERQWQRIRQAHSMASFTDAIAALPGYLQAR